MNAMWKRGLVAAMLLVPGLARAESDQSWIHVQVNDAKNGGTKVAVNLPLGLVDLALAAIKEEKLQGGKLSLGTHAVSIAEVRRMWQQLKGAGDAELVSIEDKKQTVKVERKGDRVAVLIGDKATGKDKVRVDVPVSVVDALFSSDGEDLDLKAAVSELRRTTSGEFIRVDDGDSRVRIWIDERAGS